MGESITAAVPSEKAILSALDAVPSMHIEELTRAVDSDPVAVDRQCFRLQRAGHVRAREGGLYSITSTGEQRLRVLLRKGVQRPQQMP
ncbi:hypothetical protein [Haloarchaeobius sp. DFWS5]|uniref:hypothetical protein n=1 Tax=Haloarchaeobius sp. DFWS5 TaxID=3446114 RepID=UPI003EC0B633